MSYNMNWQSDCPGCLVILLDQSGSMDDAFGGNQLGSGKKKCDQVATVLNGLLNEIISANREISEGGIRIKPRAEIAVIGYSGSGVGSALASPLDQQTIVTLPELQDNILEVETRMRKEMDDTGNIIEVPVFFPIWVLAKAAGGTPMVAAIQQATEIIRQWAYDHPDNYPPVVVNVTDGEATDVADANNPVELIAAADALKSVATRDGNALLFNCHITDKASIEIQFPGSEALLPNDRIARSLFAISSPVPESGRQNILATTGTTLAPEARGFIYNGDAGAVRQMFVYLTKPLVNTNR